MSEKVVFRFIDDPEQHRIDTYVKNGGYRAFPKALKEFSPEQVIDTVKRSGLRGRGGAGFSTGAKWGFVPKVSSKPKFFLCNADESEPGTFKDRELIEKDPHQLIEGLMIGSYAIGAHLAFIYIRAEFGFGAKRLEQAIREAYDKGYLGKNILGSGYDLDLILFRGAGAYICGEETSLLSSIEGIRPLVRLRPPYPAVSGCYGCPSNVNNVETLSNVPHIILNGAEWFANIGTPKSSGTKIFCLSGPVNKPGNYELPMGTPLRELIEEHGGGMRGGKKLKAFIPGGASSWVMPASKIDVKLDFESVAEAGSALGSGGVIVMNEDTCMVRSTLRLVKFYEWESCGECTPCREGTYWLSKIMQRIEDGKGRMEDLDLLLDLSDNVYGKTICPLGESATMPVTSTIALFREEYEVHIKSKRCPFTK